MAVSPFEVIAGPAKVYIATANYTMPATTATPSGSWVDLGYTEGGVTVTINQEVNLIEADQTTAPLKAIRQKEGLEVEFGLASLTLENMARVMDALTVTTATNDKWMGLSRGSTVAQQALLVRGPSPYGDWNMQFELPYVSMLDNPSVQFLKDNKSVLSTRWTAMQDPGHLADSQRYGRLIAKFQ